MTVQVVSEWIHNWRYETSFVYQDVSYWINNEWRRLFRFGYWLKCGWWVGSPEGGKRQSVPICIQPTGLQALIQKSGITSQMMTLYLGMPRPKKLNFTSCYHDAYFTASLLHLYTLSYQKFQWNSDDGSTWRWQYIVMAGKPIKSHPEMSRNEADIEKESFCHHRSRQL